MAVIDALVKNKWRWDWQNEITECDGEKIPHRTWCVKLNRPGLCLCTVCNVELKYGSNGKKRLKEHALHPEHQKNLKVGLRLYFFNVNVARVGPLC